MYWKYFWHYELLIVLYLILPAFKLTLCVKCVGSVKRVVVHSWVLMKTVFVLPILINKRFLFQGYLLGKWSQCLWQIFSGCQSNAGQTDKIWKKGNYTSFCVWILIQTRLPLRQIIISFAEWFIIHKGSLFLQKWWMNLTIAYLTSFVPEC